MLIKQNLVSTNKYSIKCPYTMTPTRIVVHNTANDASAANEVQYMISNNNEVSFHYAVDDKEVVQGVPANRNTWHTGDGEYGVGNRQGIAIEICYSKSGGDRFIQAERNAAKLVAQLLKQYNWGIDKVTKHQDYSKKYCPHRTLDMGWDRFLSMVKQELGGVEPYSGYVEVIYNGSDGLDVHSEPTFDGCVATVARKGEVFTVVGRVKVEGVYMYKLKSGLYITSATQYVKFRKKLHE